MKAQLFVVCTGAGTHRRKELARYWLTDQGRADGLADVVAERRGPAWERRTGGRQRTAGVTDRMRPGREVTFDSRFGPMTHRLPESAGANWRCPVHTCGLHMTWTQEHLDAIVTKLVDAGVSRLDISAPPATLG